MQTSDGADRQKVASIPHLQHYKDNWYRFLIHKLVIGCPDADSLLKNTVTFVTFNYDVSLEFQLHRALSAIAQFSGTDAVRRFFEGYRFIHIYGKVRENPIASPASFDLNLLGGATLDGPQPQPGPPQLWQTTKAFFDRIHEASRGIRTIAPDEKAANAAVEAARTAIADADCIYILGYGFDENNSRLLELPGSLELAKTHKTVMFPTLAIITLSTSRPPGSFLAIQIDCYRIDLRLSVSPLALEIFSARRALGTYTMRSHWILMPLRSTYSPLRESSGYGSDVWYPPWGGQNPRKP